MRTFTKILLLGTALCLPIATSAFSKDKTPVPTWTDPAAALAEDPSFALQGEYAGEGTGVQAAAMADGQFLVLTYQGGLPDAGWDESALKSEILDTASLKAKVQSLKKIERQSPTMGKAAPEGALIMLQDGKATEHLKGEVKDGLIWAGSKTETKVGDFSMHLEFRLPYKPARTPSSQDRGNSGVYIFNNYEIQVLDSFALDFRDKENNAIEPQSDNKQWCGSFYKLKLPDMPMSRPPLTWQTYDIDFTAPKFEGDKKVANARITVRHNGVLIHDDYELETGTGAGGKRPEKPEDYIYLQGHGNPVAYRNFWVLPK